MIKATEDSDGNCLHADFWIWEVKGLGHFDHIKYCKRCGAVMRKSWGDGEQWHTPELPRAEKPILPEPCSRAHLGEAHDLKLSYASQADIDECQTQVYKLYNLTACLEIACTHLEKRIDAVQEKLGEMMQAAQIDGPRLDALTTQGERHDGMLAALAEASVLKRLDALAEQGEEHGKVLASLAEDIDFLKGGALRSAAYYGR